MTPPITVEHSGYVHPDHRGRGAGAQLFGALIASTEQAGTWITQSGIYSENTANLALHHHAGVTTVGTCHRISQYHGAVLLEHRSLNI